jgi:hypothetical protein
MLLPSEQDVTPCIASLCCSLLYICSKVVTTPDLIAARSTSPPNTHTAQCWLHALQTSLHASLLLDVSNPPLQPEPLTAACIGP